MNAMHKILLVIAILLSFALSSCKSVVRVELPNNGCAVSACVSSPDKGSITIFGHEITK